MKLDMLNMITLGHLHYRSHNQIRTRSLLLIRTRNPNHLLRHHLLPFHTHHLVLHRFHSRNHYRTRIHYHLHHRIHRHRRLHCHPHRLHLYRLRIHILTRNQNHSLLLELELPRLLAPDLPSNGSSLRDLDCTHSNYQTRLSPVLLFIVTTLCIVKEKLSEHEKCGELVNGHADLSSKICVLENELIIANGKLRFSEEEIFSLQQQLKEKNLSSEAMSAELGYENMVISKLETRVLELESEVRDNKHEIEDLKGVISASNQTIEQYKTQLADASEKFLQEKSHLDADILNLEGVIKELKEEIERISQEKLQLVTSTLEQQHLIEELKSAAELSENFLQEKSHFEADTLKLELVIKDLKDDIKRISKEKSQLEARILEHRHLIKELKATAEVSADKFSLEKSSLKGEISALSQSNAFLEAKLIQLETEKVEACNKSDRQIAELNLSLEALKQKVTNLLLEKDELGEQIIALNDDIRCRDDCVCRMDKHLHQLHLEHVKLVKEIEETRKAGTQLKEQVRELEEEVEKQRVAISDGAEGKREAIRQLCFSLEHYRGGYHHLRQVLQGHGKRSPTVMAI